MAVRQRQHPSLQLLIATLVSAPLCAQQAAAPSPPPNAPAPAPQNPTLSSSLGVYVFPTNNQTATQQSADEGSCFGWAKSQTGIDPMSITPQQPAQQASSTQPASDSGAGTVVKGAAGGAVAGTAIGAIAGNTGKGAAIGATTGAFAGIAAKRKQEQQATAQQQQAQTAAQQQAQASVAQQKATYNKAFSACMEGKGYTVK